MKKYLGIDIGGTKIKFGVLNENGQEILKNEIETPKNDYNKFIEIITDIITKYDDIEGVGMSIPGCINSSTGYISNGGALRYLDNINLKEELEKYTGLKLAFENDANCVALAEKWIGNAKDSTDFMCITVGTGIGGALFVNDKLCTGKNNFAGEFGYMVIDDVDGVERISTMSKVASTEALRKEVAKLKNMDFEMLSGLDIFEMIKNNDLDVIMAYKKWMRRLAVGIYNLGFCIDPKKILIGGGISLAPNFIDDLKAELVELVGAIGNDIPKVTPSVDVRWDIDTCKYFNDSGRIGAVYNLLRGFKVN